MVAEEGSVMEERWWWAGSNRVFMYSKRQISAVGCKVLTTD